MKKSNEKIISMTYDYINNVLYFSTNDAIYAIKDNQAGCVIQQIGGLVKYYCNELYVFNPKNKFLISFYINNVSVSNQNSTKGKNKNVKNKRN